MGDKKEPPHSLGSSKSYTLDGDTAEFNPYKLQAHEFSPELRQQVSELKPPRLDPKYLNDTLPPNATAATHASAGDCASDAPAGAHTSADAPTPRLTARRERRVIVSNERARFAAVPQLQEQRRIIAISAAIAVVGGAYLMLRPASTPLTAQKRIPHELGAQPSAAPSEAVVIPLGPPSAPQITIADAPVSDAARPPALAAKPVRLGTRSKPSEHATAVVSQAPELSPSASATASASHLPAATPPDDEFLIQPR